MKGKMINRKKVIRALEICNPVANGCRGCPYDVGTHRCLEHLHRDALALLKVYEGNCVMPEIIMADPGRHAERSD